MSLQHDAIKKFKQRPFLWVVILGLASIDTALYLIYGYPYPSSIFVGVFINLFIISITILLSFSKNLGKEADDRFIKFLDIPDVSIKYSHITSFIGDQISGTFFTAITLVYTRKIFTMTGSMTVSALFAFSMFLFTITFVTLSLSKIFIQLFRAKHSLTQQFFIVIVLVTSFFCIYMSGIELAPKIDPKVQQSMLEKT